jgi:tripartite ATP-independent transporter DctP family solute receptor
LDNKKEVIKLKKLLRVILVVALVVVSVSMGSLGLAAQKKMVIKLAHADPIDIQTSRKQAMCVAFANMVNSKSQGQLQVQVFGAGSLGGEREYVEAIKSGMIQAGIASGCITNFYQDAMVTDIPYLFPSAKVAWAVMDGPFGKKLAAGFLKATGIRTLAFGEVGFRHFSCGKKLIRSPKDMQGLKIRVQESPFYMTLIKSMGGTPTPVSATEMYAAAQTGVVDGIENVLGSIVSAKIYEVNKYVTLDGHTYGVDWFVINDRFFKSLKPSLQRLIMQAAKSSVNVERRFVADMDTKGIKILKDNKVEVYTPNAEELASFKSSTQKPCLDWMKTKVSPTLIDEAFKAVKTAEAKVK